MSTATHSAPPRCGAVGTDGIASAQFQALSVVAGYVRGFLGRVVT